MNHATQDAAAEDDGGSLTYFEHASRLTSQLSGVDVIRGLVAGLKEGMMSDNRVIPEAAVAAANIYSCVTHGYATKVRDELVRHVDNNAGCKMHMEVSAAAYCRSGQD